MDTKGTNNPTTFLHFLVDTAEKYFPDMLHFLEELEECGEACKGMTQPAVASMLHLAKFTTI